MAVRKIPNLEIHYSGEWAALYADGRLVTGTVGDAYLAEERAFALHGIKQVFDDGFMQGQTSITGVAQTLKDVEDYRLLRETSRIRAAELREQAQHLLNEAQELET